MARHPGSHGKSAGKRRTSIPSRAKASSTARERAFGKRGTVKRKKR